mgnify:CR=1 FL=1
MKNYVISINSILTHYIIWGVYHNVITPLSIYTPSEINSEYSILIDLSFILIQPLSNYTPLREQSSIAKYQNLLYHFRKALNTSCWVISQPWESTEHHLWDLFLTLGKYWTPPVESFPNFGIALNTICWIVSQPWESTEHHLLDRFPT